MVVVADNTDILVLLFHAAHKIYLQTKERVVDIQATELAIGGDMTKSLLFAHAISGHDITTSKPFGSGKTKPFKELKTSADLRRTMVYIWRQACIKGVNR